MAKRVVQVESLRKVYGSTVAVDDVSFEVREGEIFGIVGPNGAGKTTTIECLEGLRRPDGGTLRVLDLDPQLDGGRLRNLCGMQLQRSNLPDRMQVAEALDLYSAFYAHPVEWRELSTRLGLDDKQGATFSSLSGGQRQRLFIALALLPDPRLVFLDELTTGLDPQARHATWDLVRDVREQGKTVLLTTHFMEEAERLCDRVAIMDRGRIIALDTPEALIRSVGAGERVVFQMEAMPAHLRDALASIGNVAFEGEHITVSSANVASGDMGHGAETGSVFLFDVVRLLSESGVAVRDLRTERSTLEDVFLQLTGTALRE